MTGIWNRAVLVVTPDHGAAFTAHRYRRTAVPANLGQIASIPAFIKAPGQRRGRVVLRHSCTTDILPRVAALLGVRYPWRRVRCPAREVVTASASTEAKGETVARLPLAEVVRQRSRFVGKIARLFPGPGWGPVLRFGPAPELIGARAAPLVRGAGGAESASLENPERLRAVKPRSAAVFASLLRGPVQGGHPGEAIAAAVNGTIATTGLAFDEDGQTRFSMLVPPRFFRSGPNRVDLYRVTGRGRSATLERLGP